MIYGNIYFKECNHVKIVFEKNAEFNVLSSFDLPNVRERGQNIIAINDNKTLYNQHFLNKN
jgi:hypothetical protein